MKIPSRKMPAYTQPAQSRLAASMTWALLSAFAAVVAIELYIGITMRNVGAVIIGAGLSISWIAGWLQEKARAKKLQEAAMSRSGQSICEFAREFDREVVDTWIIPAVYEQLQEEIQNHVVQFPVRKDDALDGFLVSDPDDLDLTLVREIAQRTGRSLESTNENPFYDKVRTAGDLVEFFKAQPRENAT